MPHATDYTLGLVAQNANKHKFRVKTWVEEK